MKIVTTTLILAEKIYRSKIEGVDPFIIQKMQQEWDEQMANSSKAKGTGYENELVKKIQAKRRKSIPKWMSMGNCDVVMYREDRGITFVSMTYDDWIRCLKSVLL